MSYIKKTLTTNERLVILKRRHKLFWFKPVLWSGVLSTVLCYGYIFFYKPFGFWETAKALCVIIGLVLLPIWLVYMIKYYALENAVTTKRVIVKMGFIRIDTDELRNEQIENIQIKQSLLGRLFRYGNLEFKGMGGTEVVFLFIADPVDTKKAIESIIFKNPSHWRPQIG